MTAWKRWQDWATIILGVALVAMPFVFNVTTSTLAWAAYVLGALLALSGIWTASTDEPNVTLEWMPLVLGAVTFLAPWILNVADGSNLVWSMWIIGGIAFVNAVGDMLFVAQGPRATPV